jgi:hypothetical protein
MTPMAGNLRAQEAPWEIRLTPYIWVPSVVTNLGIEDSSRVESDRSLLEVLDFAFLMSGEVRKGDWGLIGEFNYLRLSNDASTAGGLIKANVEIDGIMAGAAPSYRFYRDRGNSADIYAGFRVWSLDSSIDFQRLPKVSLSKTWVDPIVGLRGAYNLTDSFFVGALGEAGGFGVGSNLQWEIVGRGGYRFNDAVSLVLGYRHLVLDFENGGLNLNMTISGPFLALDVAW